MTYMNLIVEVILFFLLMGVVGVMFKIKKVCNIVGKIFMGIGFSVYFVLFAIEHFMDLIGRFIRRAIGNIWRLMKFLRSQLLKSWLKSQKYILPSAYDFRAEIEGLKIASYIAREPYWHSCGNDYIIYSLNIRLNGEADRIAYLGEEIERVFTEMCIMRCGKSPAIYIKELTDTKLVVWIAQNRYGDRCLMEERIRDDMRKAPPERKPSMNELVSSLPIAGYEMQMWEKKGIRKEICIDVRKYPGALICGPSGSGKSVFLTVFLSEVLTKFRDEIGTLYYLDFKSASESRYLREYGYHNYYCGGDCAEGLEAFYRVFCAVRESGIGDKDKRLNLLIFDEAASFLLSEQTKGREGKALAEKHTAMLTEIGLLGRSFGCGIWLVAQQPSADYLKTALRESLHSKICFLSGGFSPEMKRMIGVDDETADQIKEHGSYGVGSAVVLRQSEPAVICQVPKIKDITVYQERIVRTLPTA